jgi:glutamine synthetase type III
MSAPFLRAVADPPAYFRNRVVHSRMAIDLTKKHETNLMAEAQIIATNMRLTRRRREILEQIEKLWIEQSKECTHERAEMLQKLYVKLNDPAQISKTDDGSDLRATIYRKRAEIEDRNREIREIEEQLKKMDEIHPAQPDRPSNSCAKQASGKK